MYTQCPECKTLFRISPDQLKAAGGNARCCRCDTLFNALDYLREELRGTAPSPLDAPETRPATEPANTRPEATLTDRFAGQPGSGTSTPDTPEHHPSDTPPPPFHTPEERGPKTEVSPLLFSDYLAQLNSAEGQNGHSQSKAEESGATLAPRPAPGASIAEMDHQAEHDGASEAEYALHNLAEETAQPGDPAVDGEQDSSDRPPLSFSETEQIDTDAREEMGTAIGVDPSTRLDTTGNATADFTTQHHEPADKNEDKPLSSLGGKAETSQPRLSQALPESGSAAVPEQPPLDAPRESPVNNRPGSLIWVPLILLLLFSGVAQLVWFEREHINRYPGGHQFLVKVCAIVGCTIQPQQAPEAFKVLERALTSHPSAPNALLLRLTFVNDAPFPQPFPRLLLSLYDSNESLVARRLFHPREYMDPDADTTALIKAGEKISIDLSLADPGSNVTGFKFSFN